MSIRNFDSVRPGSKKTNKPKVFGVVLNEYLENSGEPLAVAFRKRLFRDAHPNTELCVDLKLVSRRHGRLKVGGMLDGTIVRDGDEHFTFMERGLLSAGRRTVRNVHFYEGKYINVNMRADGVIYPTFRYGQLYREDITFREFCYKAARELVEVAGRIEE